MGVLIERLLNQYEAGGLSIEVENEDFTSITSLSDVGICLYNL